MSREDMDFIERLFRSLETEMNKGFAHVAEQFTETNARLDQANARLDRIGGLVNGGARALTRLAEWSEATDRTGADVLRRLGAVEERLRKLEGEEHK